MSFLALKRFEWSKALLPRFPPIKKNPSQQNFGFPPTLNAIWKSLLNGKRLYPTKSVIYLGIKTDESLTWNEHINDVVIKLNRGNAMLYKVKEFVNPGF